jgi:arylsulfatase
MAATPKSATDRPIAPNVLLILADDLGYSDVGCYGSEIPTPHLDRLAANGLRFTQFYNAGRCWPTRGALLTGYYAQQIRRDTIPGIASGGAGIRPPWARLLPAMLRPLGYRSYHSGKWHIDGNRLPAGFDRSYSLEDHNRYFAPQHHSLDDRPLPPVAAGSGYYVTTAVADHAIRCLRDHATQHAGKPFFHYLCFTAPHFPLMAPADAMDQFRQTYRDGWSIARTRRWQSQRDRGLIACELSAPERSLGPPYAFPEALEQLGPGEVNRPLDWNELSSEQQAFQSSKMAVHAAMVHLMDREIGRVLAQVQSMGAWDNTLVLFLSDNGASAEIMVRGDGHDRQAPLGSAASYLCLGPGWSTVANTPFRRHKTWVHEGGIATPLIVHWPAGIAAYGELRHSAGHVIDLVPTILELAGQTADAISAASRLPSAPGRSLANVFQADDPAAERTLWWLHEGNRAIRRGRWKLVAARDAPWELYDLSVDRAEMHDQAAARPELVRELEQAWNDQFAAYRDLAMRDDAAQ